MAGPIQAQRPAAGLAGGLLSFSFFRRPPPFLSTSICQSPQCVGPAARVEAPLRRASTARRLLWRCSTGRVQGSAACLCALPLPSKPPHDRRIARTGRCPGLRAWPPSSPGPRRARLRLAGGPWTSALVARFPCVEAAPKADVQPARHMPQKGQAMHANSTFNSSPRAARGPTFPGNRTAAGVPPVPPEDSPQAGGCVAESPATAARGRDRMDVRQAVTDRIIAMLDKGGSVFRERWTRAAARGVPRNGKTGASAGCPRSRPVASESCCRIAGSQPQCADRRTVVKTGSPRAYLVEGARPD